MSRMRSFTFPRSTTAKHEEESMESPYRPSPTHSRSSSGASSTSSPIASTFSSRSHNRWPSSSSSLATTPDSPVNVAKSALHDLVEDPAEREDALSDLPSGNPDEPLCICDTPFCEHRETPRLSQATVVASHTPEWSPGDDYFSDGELPGNRSFKRRRSADHSNESLTGRLNRHWPSMSARWRDRKATTAVSDHQVQSAPPSRSSSTRLSSSRRSLATHIDPALGVTPPVTPVDFQPEVDELTMPRRLSRPQKPVDIVIPESADEPVDRQELASTPLLPPAMNEHLSQSQEALQSPLQSPSVAEPGSAGSLNGTPLMTPITASLPTPPLSSKPSVASFGMPRSQHALQASSSSDIPPMAIDSEETDPWALKLGHANFHITPAPYFPELCDLQSCKRLLDDWELARMEYMHQAARISEHYGPTSQTYKFTEQKWAEIDAQWRAYHERANAEAGVSADTTLYQPLAETQPLSKMPSLNDPEQPAKFPKIDDADIVGPMVQYAKIQRRPSRKPAFLKLFTDPASLLGGRSPFGPRR